MTRRYMCLGCLSRSMSVRLDKKGRPMLSCEMCSQVIFARSPLKLFNFLGVSNLLEDKEMLRFVRETAVKQAAKSTALGDVLRQTEDTGPSTPSARGAAVNE